jgi:hypothetical protein
MMQRRVRRDASWEDVFNDMVGVVCALAIHLACTRREKLATSTRAVSMLSRSAASRRM